MTEYSEGDLVQVEMGERVHRGRVEIFKSSLGSARPHLTDCNEPAFLDNADGWTITVIEKAKPKVELPSEPGYYLGSHIGMHPLIQVGIGGWVGYVGNEYRPAVDTTPVHELIQFAPFTRLEPRAVTAKAVLDAVRGMFGAGALLLEEVDKIATEFGVTSND